MHTQPKLSFMQPLLRLWAMTGVVICSVATKLTAYVRRFLALCWEMLFGTQKGINADTKIPYIVNDAQSSGASFLLVLNPSESCLRPGGRRVQPLSRTSRVNQSVGHEAGKPSVTSKDMPGRFTESSLSEKIDKTTSYKTPKTITLFNRTCMPSTLRLLGMTLGVVLLSLISTISKAQYLTNVGPVTVTTDKPDYAPRSTAIFTGTGFQPGEIVQLRVKNLFRACNTVSADSSYLPWTDTADATGSFQGIRDREKVHRQYGGNCRRERPRLDGPTRDPAVYREGLDQT